jgi:EmrB/QacA subfamily drug resistance transporter
LIAVCLGTFMLLVDVTIVTVALPAISTSLDASFSSLRWILDIYALLLAALVMAAGATSDLVGRRKTYLGGLVVFAIASLACGISPNIETLIAARAVQGLGAAAMFATTTALIAATYSGKDRGIAFGLWGAVNGAAAASGPIIGGLLTEHISWRAIFLVNLPVAALALAVSILGLEESRNPSATRVDVAGTAVFTLTIGGIVFGVIRGSDDGWGDPITLVSLGIAVIGIVIFVLVERGRPHAMLDLALMRKPAFAAMMFAALMLNGCAFANLAFVSVWLQSVQGLDPVRAGLVFMPLSITSFLLAAITGRQLHRVAPKLPVGIGMLLIGAGVLMQIGISASSGWTALLPGLFVTGLGVGMTNPALADAALAAAPRERAGMAGGATNTFRQLGYALGIAALGTVFVTRATQDLGLFSSPAAAASALSSGQSPRLTAAMPAALRAAAEGAIRSAFADGLGRVFLMSGLGALLAGVIALGLVKTGIPGRHRRSAHPTGGAAAELVWRDEVLGGPRHAARVTRPTPPAAANHRAAREGRSVRPPGRQHVQSPPSGDGAAEGRREVAMADRSRLADDRTHPLVSASGRPEGHS